MIRRILKIIAFIEAKSGQSFLLTDHTLPKATPVNKGINHFSIFIVYATVNDKRK